MWAHGSSYKALIHACFFVSLSLLSKFFILLTFTYQHWLHSHSDRLSFFWIYLQFLLAFTKSKSKLFQAIFLENIRFIKSYIAIVWFLTLQNLANNYLFFLLIDFRHVSTSLLVWVKRLFSSINKSFHTPCKRHQKILKRKNINSMKHQKCK